MLIFQSIFLVSCVTVELEFLANETIDQERFDGKDFQTRHKDQQWTKSLMN